MRSVNAPSIKLDLQNLLIKSKKKNEKLKNQGKRNNKGR